jgi:hypothetical protein
MSSAAILTGNDICPPKIDQDMVVIRGRGTLKIIYRVWTEKLRICGKKLKLNTGCVIVDGLHDKQKEMLVGFGVPLESESDKPTITWKSAAFETSYFGVKQSVVGKTYNNTFGVLKVDGADVADWRDGWQSKPTPWLIVHLESGFCIACVTSKQVARQKVEGAFDEQGALREPVASRIL